MTSEIKIQVTLDEDKMPETIHWQAPEGGIVELQPAKALLLGLWDGEEKTAMRIDLWTNKMMVNEMNDFFYQTLHGLANTYAQATNNTDLALEMKNFAKTFIDKANKNLEQEG